MIYRSRESSTYRDLMSQYSIGSLLAKVLESFSYSETQQSSFLRGFEPIKSDDPALERLGQMLEQIREEGKKVFVFGDYDCDGICSTTIMIKILNALGIASGFYIPNRLKEGYGLNLERLAQAREKGYDVLITVDNGVSAIEELTYARQTGMTVIVIDHHQYQQDPPCDLLIHPLLMEENCHYLCATGLTYLIADNLSLVDDPIRILTALATIADVMELKGINPALVHNGIEIMNQHRWTNIEQLMGYNDSPINEDYIGFRVTPLINAPGRMPDYMNPVSMVRYFLADDQRVIIDQAAKCQQLNQLRKSMTSHQLGLIMSKVDESDEFILAKEEQLHEGLIGIIAGRVSEQYRRPVIIFSKNGDILKGSGRCQDDDDIMETLQPFADRFIHFGGHKQACGITMKDSDYDDLKEYLKSNYHLQASEAVKEYVELNPADLTVSNLRELFSYRPFGQGRRLPLFSLETDGTADYRSLKNDHQLKWTLKINGMNFSVLSFDPDNAGYQGYLNKKLRFIGQLQENWFRSAVSYQLLCEEIIIL